MSDDTPTMPSSERPEPEPPSTDPGGHEPPPSVPPDISLRQVAELVLLAMREHHRDLRRELGAHQRDELEHHRAVDANLTMLVEHRHEQDARLAALERRVADLEVRARTDRPSPSVDSLEPGGES